MNEEGLLILLESILGKGLKSSKGNYKFVCPFHISNPPGKLKLEVNLKSEQWHCWGCDSRGKKISNLLKDLNVSKSKFEEYKFLSSGVNNIEVYNQQPSNNFKIELPKEFRSLINNDKLNSYEKIIFKHALKYLNDRNITLDDIIKYNLGFCTEGVYENRIIIPSYDEKGSLNYFMARDFTGNSPQKYKNPFNINTKDVIGWELYINWNAPIIIVEGIFDALTVKRNVIPLFGKILHEKLIKKILENNVNRIYIALDKDALNKAIKYCETLLKYGKEVYLVELNDKDPNQIGFENFLKILEQTESLTFKSLIEKKIQYI